jgi:hypothetical protein
MRPQSKSFRSITEAALLDGVELHELPHFVVDLLKCLWRLSNISRLAWLRGRGSGQPQSHPCGVFD